MYSLNLINLINLNIPKKHATRYLQRVQILATDSTFAPGPDICNGFPICMTAHSGFNMCHRVQHLQRVQWADCAMGSTLATGPDISNIPNLQ